MFTKTISVIEAPSVLGLKPSGVENLPTTLKTHNLVEKLNAKEAGSIVSPPYNPQRNPEMNILNPESIRDFSIELALKVQEEQSSGTFPLVLGGDCSIVIGCLLALRRQGEFGLYFLDGHADFYKPIESPTGEVADMDLAIVTGRGPEILTNIDNLRPLVKDINTVAFGYRDKEEQKKFGSQDIEATDIHTVPLETVRKMGVRKACVASLNKILENSIEGFWIHLDADVLDDAIMPAVDYRLDGGLSFQELSEILSILLDSGKASGMSVSIFNPALDKDGSIAEAFVQAIVEGFK